MILNYRENKKKSITEALSVYQTCNVLIHLHALVDFILLGLCSGALVLCFLGD